ncbi:4-hydroxy-tetrahydrodipicolinate synthase [Brevibacillus reuszeri]|uniref:4-hydroxy-tetrahydrodipicolinate synthase n=1 Tax=Brevibacillus reuszeri TaxID=54915 RepID=UPI003D22A5AA
MKYNGIMTALVTPIDDRGIVDAESLQNLIQFQLKNNVSSLLVLGGTGEYSALSNAERQRAIDITVQEVNGKVPVVAGIIAPGIGDAIEFGLYAKCAGVDAIMPVTPYYVSPTQEGIMKYYQDLDTALDMPMFLYNIPYKTAVNLQPETVEYLVEKIPNIIGIKECSPNLGQFIDLTRRVGEKIYVLSGEEFLAMSEMVLGAHGAVMASANLVPDVWVKMWEHLQKGSVQEAVKLNTAYYPLFRAIFKEGNPGPLKTAMNMTGLLVGNVSTPLLHPSTETVNELTKVMKQLQLCN